MPMVDVCHRYLHTRRSWPPGCRWLLLKDYLGSMSSTWPEQCQQGHLTAEGDVFRAWHSWSPLLWQWPTICKCPVCQLLYILGHHTWNLKFCHYPQSNGFAEACIKSVKHALQPAKYSGADPPSRLTSTLSYTNQHQASISSRAVVRMPTQNNHSSQDMQQWPSSPTSPWADWCKLWIC